MRLRPVCRPEPAKRQRGTARRDLRQVLTAMRFEIRLCAFGTPGGPRKSVRQQNPHAAGLDCGVVAVGKPARSMHECWLVC